MTDPVTAARRLIGMVLVHETEEGRAAGRIVETEAYGGTFEGHEDDAFHAYKGKTARTEVLFGEGGHAYVYLIYGMYSCMNVVVSPEGTPAGVLIRAVEPLEGISLMKARRKGRKEKDLARGPGRLCLAMGIGRKDNGADLVTGPLWIDDDGRGPFPVESSKRIHVDYARWGKEFPWRFTMKGSPWVSR